MMRKLTLRHMVIGILGLVAIFSSIGIWVSYFQIEKEHNETVHVWAPNHAVELQSLFDGGLGLYAVRQNWKDTHTLLEYKGLDAEAHFFVVGREQIMYLAIVRKSDGVVSAARTTIPIEFPGSGLLKAKVVTLDPETGTVTAQYTRQLTLVVQEGVLIPLVIWALLWLVARLVCKSRWNTPIYYLRRASA